MFNLFDVMRSAQGSAAINTMARQFGLNHEQAQRAMDALLPAFAMAFQHNAANPNAFAGLLAMMGSGQYAKYFDNPTQAFTAQALQQGNELLAQVFGNRAFSRLIAEESAAVAGIAPEIMKQIMAPAAAMLMGGLSQTAASQGLAAYFDQLADMFRGGPRPGPRSAAQDPFSAWAQMWTGMMGGGQPPQAREAEPQGDATPHPLGPWGAIMTGFMRGLQPGPNSEPEPETPPPPRNPFDLISEMFEAGRGVQEQHLAALQSIFDAYWKPPKQS
jgi:hypothetical protein